jgi:hypothetical protein
MWHCTKVSVRTAETTQCCAAGADLQRDEIVSTSGSDHRGFLETCAAKICVIFYSISDARVGTHAPDDPFYVSPSLAGSCISWITFC